MTILEWEDLKGLPSKTAEICFLSFSSQVSSTMPSETSFSKKTFLAMIVFSRIHFKTVLDLVVILWGLEEDKVCPRVFQVRLWSKMVKRSKWLQQRLLIQMVRKLWRPLKRPPILKAGLKEEFYKGIKMGRESSTKENK